MIFILSVQVKSNEHKLNYGRRCLNIRKYFLLCEDNQVLTRLLRETVWVSILRCIKNDCQDIVLGKLL